MANFSSRYKNTYGSVLEKNPTNVKDKIVYFAEDKDSVFKSAHSFEGIDKSTQNKNSIEIKRSLVWR